MHLETIIFHLYFSYFLSFFLVLSTFIFKKEFGTFLSITQYDDSFYCEGLVKNFALKPYCATLVCINFIMFEKMFHILLCLF